MLKQSLSFYHIVKFLKVKIPWKNSYVSQENKDLILIQAMWNSFEQPALITSQICFANAVAVQNRVYCTWWNRNIFPICDRDMVDSWKSDKNI